MTSDHISLKVEGIHLFIPEENVVEGMHIIFSFCLLSAVLYLCKNAHGLSGMRMGEKIGSVTDEQKTEWFQIQFLFFPISQHFNLSH